MAPTAGGSIASGQQRVIPVQHARNVTTGAISVNDVVPVDATAVTYNLTITGTSGGGFLAVSPSTATEITASSINWSGSTTIANGGVVGIANGAVKVYCGGANASTQLIIDITGYYR